MSRRRDSLEDLLTDAAALDAILARTADGMDEWLATLPTVTDYAALVADDAALNALLAEAAADLDKLLDEIR